MGYQVLYKCSKLKAHHMNQARQIQEMTPSMVRSVAAPTAPCSEHLKQMVTALDAFWKAQYLCHTHIQFQIFQLKLEYHHLLHLTQQKSAALLAVQILPQRGMATANSAS